MTDPTLSTSETSSDVSDRFRTGLLLAILLAATLLNYANRFVFTQNAQPIQAALEIGDAGYGKIAGYFGLGFALGGLTFGILADMVNVRRVSRQ